MKKIKILRAIIAVFACLTAFGTVASVIALVRYEAGSTHFGSSEFYIRLTIGITHQAAFFSALILLFLALNYFVNRGYFNAKSSQKLKQSGMLFMLSSIAGAASIMARYLFTADGATVSHEYAVVGMLYKDVIAQITFLAIGFGLYMLADFIRRGEAIETENNLTI